MKPHLYILKTLKRQHNIERDGTPAPLKFNKFFERLAENMKKFNKAKKVEDDEDLKDAIVIKSKHEGKVLNSRDAFIRSAEIEQHIWMKRRKKEIREEDQISDCINALFELIDVRKVESIEGSDFVSQLLSLGLTNDPVTIVKLLELSFKESITTLQLTKKDLLRFCKGNRKTDQILATLMKMINKAPPQSGDLPEVKEVSPKRAASPYPSLNEYMALVRRLWCDLDRDIKDHVRRDQVEAKICALHLTPDAIEARRLLGPTSDPVPFDCFQAIFARSILKGALIALDQRLLKVNLGNGNFSTTLRISTYKRRLLLAGLNSHKRSLQSREDGATALRALEQFHKMQVSPPLR